MISDAVRIEREKRKTAQIVADRQLAIEIIKNPVVEILAAYISIEWLQRHGQMPALAGTIAEAGVLTAVGMQQIAPLAPYIAQGAQGLAGSIKAIAPLMLGL